MTAVSRFDHGQRLARARQAVAAAGLDALLIAPGADLRWLIGYDALPLERLTCLAVPAAGDPFLVVPLLEQPSAEASGAGRFVRILAHGETDDAYRLTVGTLTEVTGSRPATVGVSERMWAQSVLHWQQLLPQTRWRLAGEVLQPLRLVKSVDEIAALRDAARAIDTVHQRMGEWLRPGRTEREVARDIAAAILDAGHATVNFVIVASGPNAASPHHQPGERRIEPGDPVVVDIGGAMPDGYCSDSTRTYAAGAAPPADFGDYFTVLHEAQLAACEAVRPGASAESVDTAAREIIDRAGYAEAFLHRTGHGIGLDEHEPPWIVAGEQTLLQPGMCFSIEPGIYLAGRHGARIEDIVACTATGVERLNTLERDLVVLP